MSETIAGNSNILDYRIVSKIGAGGMGEVYRAHDTKLDRKVADDSSWKWLLTSNQCGTPFDAMGIGNR